MTSPTTRDRQIFAEQVRTLYAQLPVSVPAQIVGGALLVAAMWGQVSHPTLVLWCGLLCAFQVSRLALYGAWRRRARPEENVERWRAWWATGAGLSGLVWGAAGFVMFVPDSPTHQAVLIVALLGVATGSITVIATDVTAFYAFSGAVVTPVLVRTAWEGGATYLVLAAIGAVVLAAILACGRNLSKELARSLAVYYQNLELIEELQAQKAIAERARNEAETANRAKTQFFASASHDLRQPLHAMGLFAAALAQKAHDPEVRHVVDSINSSVQALEALFSELLDIAKIDAGALKPVLAPFALADMFGRLQSDFEAEAAAKGLRLTVEGGANVVTSDALLLERIIRNLLSNAVRYTTEGAVRLTAAPAGDGVRIEVSDTGIGIRAEDRQRIFDEFFQLGNPARTSAKGMGLGLSIVQRLCALLGYELALASEYGRGSAFGFTVPRGRGPGARTGPRRGARPPRRPVGAAHRGDRRRSRDRRGHARAHVGLGRRGHRLPDRRRRARSGARRGTHARSHHRRLPAGRRGDRHRGDRPAAAGARPGDPRATGERQHGARAGPGSRGEPLRAHAEARATGEAAGADRRCAWKNGAGKRSLISSPGASQVL